MPRPFPSKTVIIIGECKDQGSIDANDIGHLRQVADALPGKRFETFVLLAKLCPFSSEEISCAKTLNERYRQRAILLTARDLEPYDVQERTALEFDIQESRREPEDLASVTARIYFRDLPAGQ
jgi:hypothetical protein